MRKLVYGINISLDGCCDHSKFGGGEDILNYFRELLTNVDLIIYGRKTYELMYPYWPEVAQATPTNEAEYAYAKTFSVLNNIVVSTSIDTAAHEKTTIIRDHVKEAILQLKQQPGKDISTGGVEFPAKLIEWGLVDEFHMVVHPVIVGQGRRLFTDLTLPENLGLQLKETKTLSSGCIALIYERA